MIYIKHLLNEIELALILTSVLSIISFLIIISVKIVNFIQY